MKTYKQINQELYSEIRSLRERLGQVTQENNLRKQVIEDNKLFDPIEYSKVFSKLAITVDALEAIRMLSFDVSREENQNHVYRIASEAFERIKE